MSQESAKYSAFGTMPGEPDPLSAPSIRSNRGALYWVGVRIRPSVHTLPLGPSPKCESR